MSARAVTTGFPRASTRRSTLCAFAAGLLLVAAGCHSEVDDHLLPKPSDVAQLEIMLAGHPCIADLQQWERNYRYSRKTAFIFPGSLNPDLDVIELHLRRVGAVTIRPGLNVMVPAPGGDWPDSRPIQSIDGRFTLSSGALILQCRPDPRPGSARPRAGNEG